MKILVITIGGSCAPIVTSINQNEPNIIHFICSDDADRKGSYITVNGEGNVCGDNPQKLDKSNILKQVNIPLDQEGKIYFIHKIQQFDDFNACYGHCFKLILDIQREHPDAEIIADYTGGTKSMSAGLAAISLDFKDITLCVMKGIRLNLVKVQNGTESIRLTQTNIAFLNRQIELASQQMEKFDFDGAISILEDCLKVSNIPDVTHDKIQMMLIFSKAYLAWDRFDHIEAWNMLYCKKKYAVEATKFLESVIWSRRQFDEIFERDDLVGFSKSPKGCGYELVDDLLLNAERKAKQARYDDAVGRLYRALELLVQVRLKLCYEINTGDVDLDKLPDNLRLEYEDKKSPKDNKIRLGLQESYDLLCKINSADELGRIYPSIEKKLLNCLSTRNNSLFAHGMSPISKQQYDEFHNIFVKDLLDPFQSTFTNKYSARTQFSIKSINEHCTF